VGVDSVGDRLPHEVGPGSGLAARDAAANGPASLTRSLLGWSARSRLLVGVLAVGLLAAGVWRIPEAPVDVLPESSPPLVAIQTEALGLSAPEVEDFITVPLEVNMLSGVPWLDRIESESLPGLSSIVMTFEPGTDVMRARQMVQERLTQAHALPNVSRPPQMIQPLSSTSRLMMIGLSSDEHSLIDMSVLARWTVRPRLMGVPGVANVSIWGQRERQLHVQVDPQRLDANGVTLDQVISTAGNALWVSPLSFLDASTPGSGGFIDTPNQRLGIRHVLPITQPDDLAQVVMEGSTQRIGDVADVVEDHQPLIGDALTHGDPGLLLVVEKFPDADALTVTRDVEEALAAMAPGLAGIEVDPSMFRPASYVESAIHGTAVLTLIALLLLCLVLAALLLDLRVVLIVAASTVLAYLAAATVLVASGATINAMVVAGFVLALVVVIDEAVVGTLAVMASARAERRRSSTRLPAALVADALAVVRGPLMYATLLLVLTAVPLLLLPGASGAFLGPVAWSYLAAALAAAVVALIVTPAIAATVLGIAPVGPRERPLVRRARWAYHRWLRATITRWRPAVVVVAVAGLASLAVLPVLDGGIVPTLRERDVLIHWDASPGTSRVEMDRVAAAATEELRAIPGVRSVGSHVGRAVLSDQVVNVSSADLWVSMDPEADHQATRNAIEDVVRGYPGLRLEASTYLNERARELLTSDEHPVRVRIYGPQPDVLRTKAEEVRAAISGIPGVAASQVASQDVEPAIEVEVDLDAARGAGLKPGDVRRASATMITGLEVGNLFEEQKVFEVVVVGVPAVRHSLSSLQDLLIDTPSGDQVRLGDVARVQMVPTPTILRREGISGYAEVTADIAGRDAAAVLGDVQQRLSAVSFPSEYHPEIVGDGPERRAALDGTISLAVAVGIGVLVLLQALFGSWRLALLAIVIVPAAVAAGMGAAVLAGGGTASIGALVGVLAVLAIATRNAVSLGAAYQRLEDETGRPLDRALALRGARERLVPVLTTAVATVAMLAPFIVAGDVAGNEIVRPIAIVIVGGVIASALLALFVLPALHLGLRSTRRPEMAGVARRANPEPKAMGAR
jgi:Cu/Ag efflux pump CusA